ncbi:serine hydrolase [Sulfuriflexus sp.]|uniref:serine hydrolase n=1 Tax=Sulfuriflexus sp. TaxID=2015443 RepID=UPI0028CEEA1D|nr:serine hydrolase [Sulfuriflexus sp.]MDT8403244.1 serine hydrolase [Sulfuriflexus sp.]
MKRFSQIALCLSVFVSHNMAQAYPLDAAAETGIQRLEGYRQAQLNKVYGRLLPQGAQLASAQIKLRLLARPALQLPPADEDFSRELVTMLQDVSNQQADAFGIAVLDLSNPERSVYAEHHGEAYFNPGSVGKVAVVMGVFQALANAWPDDIEARRKVLRESIITADDFIGNDHHKVPIWDGQRLTSRKIQVGDTNNLWSYLDWMLSASSNAAASMVVKHMMLLSHFGREYPLPAAAERRFFADTPRAELSRLLAGAFQAGLEGSGLDSRRFRQGKFFSGTGKRRVSGQTSHATPRELLRFLLHLEQGKVVDRFSSLEIKRLLYITQRRIRYASSPALNDAAVYFKSGSYYRCRHEPGFSCGKYRGNVTNLLNSVAIIEAPAGAGEGEGLFYMVVLTSNVLKHNAALLHQGIGTRLHRLIEKRNSARQ